MVINKTYIIVKFIICPTYKFTIVKDEVLNAQNIDIRSKRFIFLPYLLPVLHTFHFLTYWTITKLGIKIVYENDTWLISADGHWRRESVAVVADQWKFSNSLFWIYILRVSSSVINVDIFNDCTPGQSCIGALASVATLNESLSRHPIR